ncbi:hypothetical protein MTBLM1_30349 [Rhodospirillaceae bacterium LM-1]|nr:hypothetical protein MTBLM1_30349 [Rhodospirillaceae bacterium LM-1]
MGKWFEGVWLREDGLEVRFHPDRVEFSKGDQRLIWNKEHCDIGALERYEFGRATIKRSDIQDAGIPLAREGWKLAEKIPAFRSDCEESAIFWLATQDGKLVYLSLYEGMYDSFVYTRPKP